MNVPTGRAARAAWRALPARKRAEVIRLARQGLPHPELDVALVAVGWGRHARVRARRIFVLVFFLLLTQLAIPLGGLPGRYRHAAIPAIEVVFLAVLAALALCLAHAVRYRHAPKVEVVNLRAVLAADRAAPTALTVHRAGRFGLADLLAVGTPTA